MYKVAQILAIALTLTGSLALAEPQQITTTSGLNPTVSPDGEWVAYWNHGIVKVPAGGGAEIQLTSGEGTPDWSLEDDLIVYEEFRAIMVIAAGGGSPDTVAVVTEGDFDPPTWSPDGDMIACRGEEGFIRLITYPDGVISTIPCDGDGETPDWSPDGTTLVYEDGALLRTLDLGSGTGTILVDTGRDVGYPVWSPDGHYVAFSQSAPDSYIYSHIWIIDMNNGELFQVTTGNYGDYQPAWSPNNEWIYFSSNRGGIETRTIWRVSLLDPAPVESTSWGEIKSKYLDH